MVVQKILSAFILCGFLAGCANGNRSVSETKELTVKKPAPAGVCKLIRKSDAEEIFDAEAAIRTDAELTPIAGRLERCIWEPSGGPDHPDQTLRLELYEGVSRFPHELPASWRHAVRLNDIGERCYMGFGLEGLVFIFEVKGKVAILIYSVSGANGLSLHAKAEKMKRLARNIAADMTYAYSRINDQIYVHSP